MVISEMFIWSITWRMTSMGHGEPAMMPVLSDEKSNFLKSLCWSTAMNMVGTP